MTRQEQINLALRAIMETGIVFAFAYWGYQTGQTTAVKILFAIGAPLLGFGFWGIVDFHQAGRWAEPLRLLEELAISGLAALALYIAGQPILAWIMVGISIVYHILVYASGGRLLKHEAVS